MFSPFLKSNSIVVDIGCGDMFFYEQLGKKSIYSGYYAVDNALSTKQIAEFEKSSDNNSLHVFNSLDTLKSTIKEKASVLLLLDVIEHIESDRDFLEEIMLSPFIDSNTIFVITVPSFQSLYGPHDQYLGHKRRYSNKELEQLIYSLNLETISKGYFFTSLLILRFFYTKFHKKEKLDNYNSINKWNVTKIISELITSLLILDFNISSLFKKVRINLTGLSNYIVCRKFVL